MVNKIHIILVMTIAFCALLEPAVVSADQRSGELLFRKHCRACHPKIGRLISTGDIVEKMRNPPPFMPAFEEAKISLEDAREIENHVLNAARALGNVKTTGTAKPAASGQ